MSECATKANQAQSCNNNLGPGCRLRSYADPPSFAFPSSPPSGDMALWVANTQLAINTAFLSQASVSYSCSGPGLAIFETPHVYRERTDPGALRTARVCVLLIECLQTTQFSRPTAFPTRQRQCWLVFSLRCRRPQSVWNIHGKGLSVSQANQQQRGILP